MNQRRLPVVLFAVTVLFGALVLSASAKGGAEAPVFQSPPPLPRSASAFFISGPTSPVAIGTEFTFELGLNVENIVPGVAGAEVYIGYPANLVEPVASPGNPIAEVLPDFFGLSSVSVNEITTCQSGDYAHLVVAGPAQTTKQGAIARYHFRPIADGQICFTLLSVTLADADGYPVTTALGSDLCITKPYVTGLVLRQGTVANPNPGGGSLLCSLVTLSDGRTTLTGATVDGVYADSQFVFDPVTPGASYTVEASYSGYLKASKSFVASAGKTDVGTVYLLGGDANGDNRINIQDIGAIISEFGRTGLPVRSASVGCAG